MGHRLFDRWCGTLLGPEGMSIHCCGGWRPLVEGCGLAVISTVRFVAGFRVWLWVRGELWWRVRPYFENCTVDASIFVAKLLRAHGGCLGIRSR
jgi:hypothetical protein